MTEPATISVVIPVRDGERYLREAIDSVVAQDHRPLEVIIVDDASTDSSGDIARSYGAPVRVVRHERKLGPASRNRGILESRGEYVAIAICRLMMATTPPLTPLFAGTPTRYAHSPE